MDADDLLPPERIEVKMKRLREEPPGTVAAAEWERFYDVPGDYEPIEKSRVGWEDFEDPLEWLLLATEGQTMMPPRAADAEVRH